jgi:phenylacetate-coenzyme A ligase PaaK-like adenylate-forming protein
MDLSKYSPKIFTLSPFDAEPLVLEIFRFQYDNNPVYHDYAKALHIDASSVRSIQAIPFLPIRFFKSHKVYIPGGDPLAVFESSGTTGTVNSRHYVRDTQLYAESFSKGFERFYGPVKDWCIIGLLPSYLERGNSSLVYMVNELIGHSSHPGSGFYLHDHDALFSLLTSLEKAGQKTMLIGVTFALLDFAERYPLPLKHTTIVETGGMKGRREEMIRQEVHDVLQRAFGTASIHSEYGMTELLSQAWSKGNGIFHCPPWMKVLIRDEEDPLEIKVSAGGRQRGYLTGAINIIDLANIWSCSFIATDDAGKLYEDGSFEVLGRMDNSDLRGCSLLTV